MSDFHVAVIVGVIVGHALVFAVRRILRRTGHAARLDARLELAMDRGFDAASAFVRSESALMLVWVVLAVLGGAALVIGLTR